MSKKEKLLEKVRRNPGGLHFADFITLMRQMDWTLDHQTGSHQIWYSPRGIRISVQERQGRAKRYQVKQFLEAIGES